jgi:excinuclease UvrABC nuclease subunit
MEWKLWNSIPFAQSSYLPSHPGIYIVVDVEEEVWYVGKSINLNARWNGKQIKQSYFQRKSNITTGILSL